MEPQNLGSAPAVQTTPAPQAPAGNSSGVTGGDLFKTLVHSLIGGFAIGIGVILAVRFAGKKVILKDTKGEGTMAMNGYSPMYPPRNMPQNGRLPMYPPNMMPPNMSQRPPYMMATGEQKDGSLGVVNAWIKRNPETPMMADEILADVRD